MENVPVHTRGASAERAEERTERRAPEPARRTKKSKKKLGLILASIAVVLLVLVGGWFLYRSSAGAYIDSGKYQAVFFTNGQVYFGKLQKLGGSYFKLTDIFYLQAKDADSKNPQQTANPDPNNVQLIKLGNEIHGPDDEMIMSKDQILFFENLKKDGQVSQTITKYNNSQKK